MPAPVLLGVGFLAWFVKVGKILLTILCVAAPIWIAFKVAKELLILVVAQLLPIIQNSIPPGLQTSINSIGQLLDLNIINTLIPLAEIIGILIWAYQLMIGVIGVKVTMTIAGPLLKLQSVATSYIGWCAKITRLGQ